MANPSRGSDPSGTTIFLGLGRIPNDQRQLLDREDSWISKIKTSKFGIVNVPGDVLERLKAFHTSRKLTPSEQPALSLSNQHITGTPIGSQSHVEEKDGGGDGDQVLPPVSQVSWPSSPLRQPATTSFTPTTSGTLNAYQNLETRRFASQSPHRNFGSSFEPSPTPSQSPISVLGENKSSSRNRPQVLSIQRPLPSSSLALEDDDLEVEIPGMLSVTTPAVNMAGKKLDVASSSDKRDPSSPPCGQGSIIPCSYNDHRSPDKQPTPKRRRWKAVVFSPTSGDTSHEKTLGPSSSRPSSMQNVELNEEDISTSSVFIQDHSHHISEAFSSIPAPPAQLQLAKIYDSTQTDQEAGGETTHEPPSTAAGSSISSLASPRPPVNSNSSRRERIIAVLNREWTSENSEWLPGTLKANRDAMDQTTLELLQRLTFMAMEADIRLSSLWDEPDGCLYLATFEGQKAPIRLESYMAQEAIRLFETSKDFRRGIRDLPPSHSTIQVMDTSQELPATQIVANHSPEATNGRADDTSGWQNAFEGASRIEIAQVQHSKPPKSIIWARPFEGFCAAYPNYSGSLGDFVKACMNIKILHRKRALPKWLYDDFIRVFAEEYIPYVQTLSEEDDSALTAIEWYVQNVDEPVFNLSVITPNNFQRVLEAYKKEFEAARTSVGLAPVRYTGTISEREAIPYANEPEPKSQSKSESQTSSSTSPPFQPPKNLPKDTPLDPVRHVFSMPGEVRTPEVVREPNSESGGSASHQATHTSSIDPMSIVTPSRALSKSRASSVLLNVTPDSTYTPDSTRANRIRRYLPSTGLTRSSSIQKAERRDKSRSERLKEYAAKLKAEGRQPSSTSPHP